MENGWECPECGTMNYDNITLCVCGYDAKKEELKQSIEQHKALNKENTLSRRAAQGLNFFRDDYFGPRKITLLCLLGVFSLRGTTDGLWCIAYLIYAIAARIEDHKRYGLPIINGKRQGQTIWEFGPGRTIAAIMFPRLFQEKYLYGDEAGYTAVHIRIITAMCFFHVYIALIILLDYLNPALAAQYFTILNDPFANLFTQWPAYQETAGSLLSHGYAQRIPIVTQGYIVGSIVMIVLSLIYVYSIYEVPDLRKAIRKCYDSGKHFGLPPYRNHKSSNIDSSIGLGSLYFLSILCHLLLMCFAILIYIYI